jgi:CspA family cold shock protein
MSRVSNLRQVIAYYSQATHPMTGNIKKLTDKGFGFITQEGGEKDLFFHSSALVDVNFDELREGDAVTFEVEESDKGPRAIDVQRA